MYTAKRKRWLTGLGRGLGTASGRRRLIWAGVGSWLGLRDAGAGAWSNEAARRDEAALLKDEGTAQYRRKGRTVTVLPTSRALAGDASPRQYRDSQLVQPAP